MTHVPIVFLPDEAGIDARRSRPRGGPHPVSPEGSSALETRGWAGGQVPPLNARPPSPLRDREQAVSYRATFPGEWPAQRTL